jgi:hypothetical protein
VKIEASASDGEVFVGIADSGDAAAYLSGVEHSVVVEPVGQEGDLAYEFNDGGAPATLPEESDIWTVSAAGPGTQDVTFTPEEGDWAVVVMNVDGSASVEPSLKVGATLPLIDNVAYGLLGGGLVLLVGGGVGLWLALRRS